MPGDKKETETTITLTLKNGKEKDNTEAVEGSNDDESKGNNFSEDDADEAENKSYKNKDTGDE